MLNSCDLSIIIVNYNTREYLARCLESLAGISSGICTETIVVDNASKDLSAEMVKERFPDAVFIANAENLGFAKANNQAHCPQQRTVSLFFEPGCGSPHGSC